MKFFPIYYFTSYFMLIVLACSICNIAKADTDNTEYTEIVWTQLMPADDLLALLNPPDFLGDIPDGGSNDSLDALSGLSGTDEQADRFAQALRSTRVIEKFDNQQIRIPGFIVPLETDEHNRVTQFFIVPYFGACLHLPPPPPNQIIYTEYISGIELETLTEPFWFEGTIVIESTDSSLGNSAYTLKLDNTYIYEG